MCVCVFRHDLFLQVPLSLTTFVLFQVGTLSQVGSKGADFYLLFVLWSESLQPLISQYFVVVVFIFPHLFHNSWTLLPSTDHNVSTVKVSVEQILKRPFAQLIGQDLRLSGFGSCVPLRCVCADGVPLP